MPLNQCSSCFNTIPDGAAFCPFCGKENGSALHRGTLINDRYSIDRVLGKGSFGITYLAYDTKANDELVAIKEYFPAAFAVRVESAFVQPSSSDAKVPYEIGLNLFIAEAKKFKSITDCPNIVKIRSTFKSNGTAYFIMDHVGGITLTDYCLNHGGTISWREATRLLYPIMKDLSSLHSNGIKHLDITPDNIFISENGSAKLLNFGAARYDLGRQSSTLYDILSHGYAPTELYNRSGAIGGYSDVYSMAATLYYCITGKVIEKSVDRSTDSAVTIPTGLEARLPNESVYVLQKALSVRHDDRYQTIKEFRQKLINSDPEAYNDSILNPKEFIITDVLPDKNLLAEKVDLQKEPYGDTGGTNPSADKAEQIEVPELKNITVKNKSSKLLILLISAIAAAAGLLVAAVSIYFLK